VATLHVDVLNRVGNYASSVTSYHGGSAADIQMKTPGITCIWCVLTTALAAYFLIISLFDTLTVLAGRQEGYHYLAC